MFTCLSNDYFVFLKQDFVLWNVTIPLDETYGGQKRLYQFQVQKIYDTKCFSTRNTTMHIPLKLKVFNGNLSCSFRPPVKDPLQLYNMQ